MREKRCYQRLLWSKLHFDRLVGFVRGGLPLPVADRVDGGLRQNRMPSFDLCLFHRAIGRDDGLDLDRTLQRHRSRESRIWRRSPLDEFAGRISLLRSRALWRENQESRNDR